MNAQQRRRLKRIKQRQAESAERRLTRSDKAIVALIPAHKNICVLTATQAKRIKDVTIAHRCTSAGHRHFTRKHVDVLIKRGELEWIGGHHRIAAWMEHKSWAKVVSRVPREYSSAGAAGIACMQLVEGRR